MTKRPVIKTRAHCLDSSKVMEELDLKLAHQNLWFFLCRKISTPASPVSILQRALMKMASINDLHSDLSIHAIFIP